MPSWVYMITKKENHCIYIGSTTGQYLCQRTAHHKKPSNKGTPVANYIAENGGWDNFQFQTLHSFDTIQKQNLLELEKKEIQERQPICNRNLPIATHDDVMSRRKVTSKAWRENNPDKVKIQIEKRKQTERYKNIQKERCSTHIQCECGGTYTKQNKSNHFSREIHKQYEVNKHREGEGRSS